MRCYIFGSAKIESYEYLMDIDFSDSLIICADGGIIHANKLGIKCDIWLGDGDSLGFTEACAEEKLKFPVEKDNTDTDLAVALALSRGCRDITIIGGIGGRLDHEYSHFCLLKKIADRGAVGRLIDEKNTVSVKTESFKICPDGRQHISFFPFGGDVKNFSVKGLKYEAEGLTLECGKVQASSNSFDRSGVGEVTFDEGCVLVITSDD